MTTKDLLPTLYQNFIHLSRYARWSEELNRRETWSETVNRYFSFMVDYIKDTYDVTLSPSERKKLEDAVISLDVMPSMRALMTAGKALERDHIAGFNCAYLHVNRLRAFDETLYMLMCGTGVGFSVERQFIAELPIVPDDLEDSDTVINVADSKLGWAKAYRELLSLLYAGQIPKWDVSRIRPSGARLRTFGGRASGPGPLEELFQFTINTFRHAQGRRLNSIECHDLMCKVGDVVVVGGVRRSALISLSNLTDERMRMAKSGRWWEDNPQRALANNSVTYTERPDIGIFMQEWIALYQSKSGERGVFSRMAAKKKVSSLGEERRNPNYDFGTNPCSEIILRDREYCNLTEVVVRADDTKDTLEEKVRLATILGTFQSTLTDFRYVSSEWQKNCDEERLLGVSLTGIMDNALLNGTKSKDKLPELLRSLRDVAIKTNKEWAKKLGVNPSASITCVKPSGTVSQLVDSASGIHARHSEYYIRTVRADKKDPLTEFMVESGFPHEDESLKPDYTTVFSFPQKAPKAAVFRNDRESIDQLEMWLIYYHHWCEHKPSVTISVKEHEWFEVGAWVYKHFDEVSGVSFLPYSEHTYKQAPYQECTKEEYEALLARMPKDVDWMKLSDYEKQDMTSSVQDLACTAGGCEVL